ncbi:glycosyltransferase [Streptomyces sp. NPDC001165]|uniref:glycosyltransferase n=1 Tax=Streptomyces sp. NPDC001165 TaxID=3364546 RepID=UPI00367F4AE7
MTAPGSAPSLGAVLPASNEEAGIGAALAALASQTDTRFAFAVVDNASTDATAVVVRRFAAVMHGAALLVRTDADCPPAADWIAAARREFARGAEMACGRSLPRRDERLSPTERCLLPAVVKATAVHGRYRAEHRHPRCHAPYVLCHGHNLAITAAIYLRCGGTPRTALEGPPEDVVLLNRAREHSDRIARAERMVVRTSLRRLRAWGARRTLLWCWERRYRPADPKQVHVR